MKLGILGLPNVGKSTLFNAITNAGADTANYPFCTIEPNVGVVPVPDKRLDKLAEMYNPEKYTPATVEFLDIAGLVKGASQGEGLGNKFLSHVREADALVHVVRCFDNDNITHVDGSVDPVRDIETIQTELILSDIETLEKRIAKTEKDLKGDKSLASTLDLLRKIGDTLNSGKPARILDLSPEEKELLSDFPLLTMKKLLYVANISEDDITDPFSNNYVKSLKEKAEEEQSEVIPICCDIESQVTSLSDEEKDEFLKELGIEETGLNKLITSSYKLLGLISFLTAGPKEVRAWTITEGTKAPQAAGKIHSDFERGFIRAEVVAYNDLISCGDMVKVREKGLLRSEGKDYVMKDGDVVVFRFNV